jgi:hypothetical protein
MQRLWRTVIPGQEKTETWPFPQRH